MLEIVSWDFDRCAQENILAQVEAAAKSAPPKPPKAEPKPKGKVGSLTDALTFKAGEPGDDPEEVTEASLGLACPRPLGVSYWAGHASSRWDHSLLVSWAWLQALDSVSHRDTVKRGKPSPLIHAICAVCPYRDHNSGSVVPQVSKEACV